MAIRYNVLTRKTDYQTVVFRMNKTILKDSAETSSIYAILYYSSDILQSYVALGLSLTSSDGEYRPYVVRLDMLLEYYNLNLEVYEEVEKHLRDRLNDDNLELMTLVFSDNIKKSKELAEICDDSRYATILYCYVWLLMSASYKYDLLPNHIFKPFKNIMYQSNSDILYKALSSLLGEDKLMAVVYESAMFYHSIDLLRKGYKSTLRLGHKLIPLTVEDINHFKNVKYRPWRELYVDNLVGKLVVNLITPGVPFLGDYFFIKHTDHGMFDNDAMHTKLDYSVIGEDIVQSLEDMQKKTIKVPDQQRKNEYSLEEVQFLNNKFKTISDQLDNSIEYTKEELVMSGISMCKIVENIGFTIRDIIRIGGKDYRGMIGPLLTDPSIFSKYIFELVYTLGCLNSKLGIIQGDLHMNNAVLFPLVRTKHDETNSFILYEVNDIYYKFPHYGTYSGIIDFSRAILLESRIKEDFGKEYATEFIYRQRNAILAIYKSSFPEFYEKHQTRLNEALREKYDAIFKIVSAIDTHRVLTDLSIILKSGRDDGVKIHPKNIVLVDKIKNLAQNILTQNMQSFLIEGIEMKEFPNMMIVSECFKDFILDKIDSNETPCDIFRYSRPLKYDSDVEKNFPDFMKRKFSMEIENKYKIEPFKHEYYSEYHKQFPLDFTDMVKNLKGIKLPPLSQT